METTAYVQILLKKYPRMRQEIALLEYELQFFKGGSTGETIEAMALQASTTEFVQTSDIANRTVDVAFTYRHSLELENKEVFCELTERLSLLRKCIGRLEHCVGSLAPPLAQLIQSYYFNRRTWREVQAEDADRIAVKTLMARRSKAVALLAEQFDLLLGIGALSNMEMEKTMDFLR